MGNIISSLLSPDTIRSILSLVGGEAKYIWGLEGNLDALQLEFDKLIQTKDDLLNDVELAEQQPRTRRTYQVRGWLQRVQQMGTKVTELQEARAQEVDRLCFGGFCSSNLISSYDFGGKVVKLKQEVIDLKGERGVISDVAELLPEDAAVELAVERRVVGQQSFLDRVWRCITEKENKVGIIGFYGTGGIGKTTLLKQVNNNFRSQQHNFHVVIWTVVSKEPNMKQIQDDIGERIGLSDNSWKSKRIEHKALDISTILSQKKFALLLDDIWKPIDLTELGVPLQSLNTESKIVFTTRSLDVCGEMEADEKIEVKCLEHDEAWRLFLGKVGKATLRSHAGIPEVAEAVARECGGLPLALITIGRAMASKRTLQEWQNALRVLRTSASKFSGMEEKVYTRLKFSYDNLPSDTIRSCLLYCCLFPEDYRILRRDLIDYWVSEGFLDNFEDGYTVIGDLFRACLVEAEDVDSIKLHDVIRDMSLWITCKIEEEENFLVRAGVGSTEIPKIEEWKGVKRISLMKTKIERLSGIPTCPRLHTLLLFGSEIEIITDGFFRFMPSLRVLSLNRNRSLTKLPSGVSCLVSLQHLVISWTHIHGLPEELKPLVNLRYLNLENTYYMSTIPQQMISSFSKLQELKMMECGLSADAQSLIKELLCLEHLNHITLTFESSRAVEFLLKFPKLLRVTHSLSIRYCKSPPFNVLHPAHMEHLKELKIDGSDLEELKIDCAGEVPKVLQSGFRSLHAVGISFCTVKDLTWLVFAPNLKKIVIMDCHAMEEIISAEKLSGEVSAITGRPNLFAQLETLFLLGAGNLKSIYRYPLPFPHLKKIRVHGCPKLKKLPLNSISTKERKIVIDGEKEWWEELKWEDEATQNVYSTCFVSSEVRMREFRVLIGGS